VAERDLFRSIYWRALQANLVGAAVAFVYLSFVAPPKPEPPHSERLLYLAVAPMYVLAAAIVGTTSASGASRRSSAGSLRGASRGPRSVHSSSGFHGAPLATLRSGG
jgi:hypothetical protein